MEENLEKELEKGISEKEESSEESRVLWGCDEEKEKISILVGLNRSPTFKPISPMEVGNYEYWIRSNYDLFDAVPQLAFELSNFLNRCKFGNSKITYLDFQQFGFVVELQDENWCKFNKRTNTGEMSGKFYFKNNHMHILNNIAVDGPNEFNGIIYSKKFLFEVLISIGALTELEVFGVGKFYDEY